MQFFFNSLDKLRVRSSIAWLQFALLISLSDRKPSRRFWSSVELCNKAISEALGSCSKLHLNLIKRSLKMQKISFVASQLRNRIRRNNRKNSMPFGFFAVENFVCALLIEDSSWCLVAKYCKARLTRPTSVAQLELCGSATSIIFHQEFIWALHRILKTKVEIMFSVVKKAQRQKTHKLTQDGSGAACESLLSFSYQKNTWWCWINKTLPRSRLLISNLSNARWIIIFIITVLLRLKDFHTNLANSLGE